MPLQATSGAASYDAFGGGVAAVPNYIEECFSTTLYTGNGSTQTITNGIDLAGEGGLVWVKKRDSTTVNAGHYLVDTARGAGNYITSNSTNASSSDSQISAFNNNGFNIGSDGANVNLNGSTYVSWTFRKQPKWFDIQTWTGSGANRTIAHNLGSVPGCIIVKRTDTTGAWQVYHRSLANTEYLVLNTTAAKATGATRWNSTTPTSTVFSLGTDATVNASGGTYVAYLFAHDAGGFGLTGTDNVISCGSYTGTGAAGLAVTLGYEPQWLLIKRSNGVSEWPLMDNMRGIVTGGTDTHVRANTTNADIEAYDYASLTATGFQLSDDIDVNTNGGTYIYIAIRRGPMKVPTSGTSVFEPDLSPNSNNPRFVSGFPVDMAMSRLRTSDGVEGMDITSRLTHLQYMRTGSTNAEATSSTIRMDYMNGFDNDGDTSPNWVAHMFRRAPSFFDEVCYTGNDVLRTINHNLGVAPEMMIIKNRTSALDWAVYHAGMGNTKYIWLNRTDAALTSSTYWNDTSPTASVFTINTTNKVNSAPSPYVAYLFATCAGVSKVGSYTGTGTTLQIDCGFTGGSRFVLIKKTSGTGDWMVSDSARGIVSGSDPYLELNNTNAEVTGEDWLDTDSTGFVVNEVSGSNANTNGATYIFLAIA